MPRGCGIAGLFAARTSRGTPRNGFRLRRQVGLSQHATCFRLLDVPLHVGWKQEAALLQRLGGFLHGRHVPVVGLVAFLERQTWIAGSEPLGFRGGKRYVLTVRLAAVVLAEVRTTQRPPGGGGDRRLDWRQTDTSDLVAVLIYF